MWDPLRRKEVADTPEERVRQWFIVQLRDVFMVPVHQMMSEVGMSYGRKKYRADILVYAPGGVHLAVVECKRPDVELGPAVLEQAMRYNMVLGVSWLIVTNGIRTLIYRRDGMQFVPFGTVPDYDIMCSSSG